MRNGRPVFRAAALAAVLLVPAVSGEDSADIRVEADHTETRTLPDSSLVKEYSGNVLIRTEGMEARAGRAVFETGPGVFRLFGAPHSGRVEILLFEEDGRERVRFSACKGALFLREGAADSAYARGSVLVNWPARKARASADTVRWSKAGRKIWAGGTVSLSLPGITERGREFEARDDLKWYTMREITGTIRPRERNQGK